MSITTLSLFRGGNIPPQWDVETFLRLSRRAIHTVAPKMTKAAETYLRLKGRNRTKTFHRGVERDVKHFITVSGDKLIHDYQKVDVNRFRDWLMKKGMAGSSIQRIFSTIKAVINFALDEAGLPPNPAFTKVYIDADAGVTERQPVPEKAVKAVQARCKDADDERRWLVALISDTGLRLAEAVGALKEDIHIRGSPLHSCSPSPVATSQDQEQRTGCSTDRCCTLGGGAYSCESSERTVCVPKLQLRWGQPSELSKCRVEQVDEIRDEIGLHHPRLPSLPA